MALALSSFCGQPAPGECGARADAADQGRRAFELGQGALQGFSLQCAVIFGQHHLNQLRSTALAQGHQLAVGQGFVGHHRHGHAGFCVAGRGHAGHYRTVGLGQMLQGRLRAGRFQYQKPPVAISASSTTKANTYRQERRIISVSPIQAAARDQGGGIGQCHQRIQSCGHGHVTGSQSG